MIKDHVLDSPKMIMTWLPQVASEVEGNKMEELMIAQGILPETQCKKLEHAMESLT